MVCNRRRFELNEKEKRVYRRNDPSEWIVAPSPHVPRIVSDELWARVQGRFEAQKRITSHGPPRRYPLSGLVRCAKCGSRCVVTSSTRKGRTYHYLRCGFAYRRGPRACTNETLVRLEAVTERVVETLERNLFDPENIAYLMARVRERLGELRVLPASVGKTPLDGVGAGS